jgi:DNA-binding MarR family transcriptional regulator
VSYSTIERFTKMRGMARHDRQVEESRRLSQMLIDIAESAKRNFAETAASFDLPVHLARSVLLLDEPAPMRHLADLLGCDRSYITLLADQLEERGLIARVSGQDRRVKLLQLTKAGTALRDELSKAVAERALVLRLSDTDRKNLARLLGQLLDPDE